MVTAKSQKAMREFILKLEKDEKLKKEFAADPVRIMKREGIATEGMVVPETIDIAELEKGLQHIKNFTGDVPQLDAARLSAWPVNWNRNDNGAI